MTTATRAGVGFRSERGPILIALMLGTSLVALDSTIVATAVPSIVTDLGGFSQFPWLFSVYLLAQAVSVPVYGKLADLFGRKPIMLFGIGLFLVGSILCGFAWSMPALIAFRAVQGLGAGAVQPMSVTIAGDIYTLAERAKAGKATIYRHWSGKAQVVAEAIRRRKCEHTEQVPDTGSLRSDLLSALDQMSASITADEAIIAGVMSAMRTDPELAGLMRTEVLNNRGNLDGIIQRAVRRGELPDGSRADLLYEVVPAVVMHRLVLWGEPTGNEFTTHLVDDIVLPLLRL